MADKPETKPTPTPAAAIDPLDALNDANRPSGYSVEEWAGINENTRRSILWAQQPADYKKANPYWHKEVK